MSADRASRDAPIAYDHPVHLAGVLLRADIPCSNGCGCEEYDYCAADMWDDAVLTTTRGETP